jgi:hypothetical protein
MGDIVVTEFITVDGVAEDPGGSEGHPHGGWGFETVRGKGAQFKLDEIRATDALLLGRRTYDGFARDVRPLFTDRDRASMRWAFDLGDVAAVREHADAILEQLAAGRMPCYGVWPAEQVAVFRQWVHSGQLD